MPEPANEGPSRPASRRADDRIMKTRFALVLAASLIAATAGPAAADDDDEGKVRLLTRETATVTAGDTAWLAVNWTAEEASVADFAMVLDEEPDDGVQVWYPENTATWTGLMNGHVLDEGEIDFTAIQVMVPASFDEKYVELDFDVTWTTADGEQEDKGFDVKIPVVQYTDGDHLAQHESSIEVAPGTSTWVDVDFTGLAPVVEDLSMTVSGDLSIVYPSYGTATSLHGDSRLDDGETDTARFRVDTGDTAPGSYALATEISYIVAGESFTRRGMVKVAVTG